jgi:hypothetical protein
MTAGHQSRLGQKCDIRARSLHTLDRSIRCNNLSSAYIVYDTLLKTKMTPETFCQVCFRKSTIEELIGF